MTARSRKTTHPKDNAKGRRKKENKELSDLASQLPLPASVASQLDKASVIRLATAYLKLRRLFPHGLGKEWGEDSSVADDMLPELGKFLNKAFHGFVFILGADATILYISEEASVQLGFSQVQLTGKCFWSYVHSSDAKELKTTLSFDTDIPAFNVGNLVAEDVEIPRSFTVRMKCILPKRQAELAVDRYKVIHCRGYLKLRRKSKQWDDVNRPYYEVTGVVASGHSLSPTPSAEIKLYKRDFMFRTGFNLQFLYIDPRSQKMIGYEPTQLQGKSLYRFIHPYDCEQIKRLHETVVTKSQAISSYYRFLTWNSGWIWMQSSCIVITSNKTDLGQCLLFINNVLSECEYPNYTFATEQTDTEENKQCYQLKRSRTSLKNRKKTTNYILEESTPGDQNSMNSSQNVIPESEVSLGSNDTHNCNHIFEYNEQLNSNECLQMTNSSKSTNDKYVFCNTSAQNEHASFPYFKPALNTTIRPCDDTEFQICDNAIHNLNTECENSGISILNIIAESVCAPSALNINSKSKELTFYTTLSNENTLDFENYDFSISNFFTNSIKGNQISKPGSNNLLCSSTLMNCSNPSFKSYEEVTNYESKVQVSQSLLPGAWSLKNIEGDNLTINSCNSLSSKTNEINDLEESNFLSPSPVINIQNISTDNNQHIHPDCDIVSDEKILFDKIINVNSVDVVIDDKKTQEVPSITETEDQNHTDDLIKYNHSNIMSLTDLLQVCNFSSMEYNFCNFSNNQNLSDIIIQDDECMNQCHNFAINDSGTAFEKNISPDKTFNSLLTQCANAAKHDYNQRCDKASNFNNETISNDNLTSITVSAIEESIKRNDNCTSHVLNNIKSDTLSYNSNLTTENQTFSACNRKICIPYSLNNNINSNALSETCKSLPKIEIDKIDSSEKHAQNNFITNTIQELTKDPINGHKIFGSDHTAFINDQWTTNSHSATGVRHESATSTSFDNASESSYLDQSSPFSTYGETIFL